MKMIKKQMTKENLIKIMVSVTITVLIKIIVPELPFEVSFMLKHSINY